MKSKSRLIRYCAAFLLLFWANNISAMPFPWLFWRKTQFDSRASQSSDITETYRLQRLRVLCTKLAHKAVTTYMLANNFVKIRSPNESYHDMSILGNLVETDKDGVALYQSDTWRIVHHRMGEYLTRLNDIYTKLEKIVQQVDEKSPLSKVPLTEDGIQQDKEVLNSVFLVSLSNLLQVLKKDYDLDIQRNMLKALSMQMMNDPNCHHLVMILSTKYLEAFEDDTEVKTKNKISMLMRDINIRITEFREWVEASSNVLHGYAERLGRTAILFTPNGPEDILVKHQKHSVVCTSLWYRLHREIQEKEAFFRDFEFIRASVATAFSHDIASPQNIRIYGKGLSAVHSSLKYRVWDHDMQRSFINDVKSLDQCISRLEASHDNEIISRAIDIGMDDTLELELGYKVEDGIEMVLTIGYLYRLLNDMEHTSIGIEAWMNDIEQVNLSKDKAHGDNIITALSKLEKITFVIKQVITKANNIYYEIKDMAHEKGTLSASVDRSIHKHKLCDVRDEPVASKINALYVSLYSVKRLLMEFYEQVFTLKPVLCNRIKIFDEYDLLGETMSLVNRASTSLKRNLEPYLKYQTGARNLFDDLSRLEQVLGWVYADQQIPAIYKPHAYIKKQQEEAEFIFSQLDLTLHSQTLISSLVEDFKNAVIKADPDYTETVIDSFFKLRTIVHKALLLESSADVIRAMETKLDGDRTYVDNVSYLVRSSLFGGALPSKPQPRTKAKDSGLQNTTKVSVMKQDDTGDAEKWQQPAVKSIDQASDENESKCRERRKYSFKSLERPGKPNIDLTEVKKKSNGRRLLSMCCGRCESELDIPPYMPYVGYEKLPTTTQTPEILKPSIDDTNHPLLLQKKIDEAIRDVDEERNKLLSLQNAEEAHRSSIDHRTTSDFVEISDDGTTVCCSLPDLSSVESCDSDEESACPSFDLVSIASTTGPTVSQTAEKAADPMDAKVDDGNTVLSQMQGDFTENSQISRKSVFDLAYLLSSQLNDTFARWHKVEEELRINQSLFARIVERSKNGHLKTTAADDERITRSLQAIERDFYDLMKVKKNIASMLASLTKLVEGLENKPIPGPSKTVT